MIVNEPQVRAALEHMHDAPARLGSAKHRAIRAERMLKHTKALTMKLHNALPISAQEREAYASEAYLKALNEDAAAAAALAEIQAHVEAARMVVDIWRTEESSARAAGKFG